MGVLLGLIVAAAVLAVATAAGLVWRRREGRFRGVAPGIRATGSGPEPGPPVLAGSQLGHPLGSRATLLQFSSPFCAPCRATRQLLAGIAARDGTVAHIEVDVSDRMDLVSLLGVRKTPAVFVLGRHGEVVLRASGLPRRDEVLAAVALAAGQGAGPGRVPPVASGA
jgi:thiol-disulfide isomerase/thioredoxin